MKVVLQSLSSLIPNSGRGLRSGSIILIQNLDRGKNMLSFRHLRIVFNTDLLLGCLGCLSGNSRSNLRPTRPPLPKGFVAEYDVKYIPDGDVAQALDIYFPESPSEKPLPLLVWIHGGGWVGGSKADRTYLNQLPRGYIFASIEYRFSQKAIFPAQIQDCQAAIRWLRANAKKYNIDPDHIGVGGLSAGGPSRGIVGTSGGKKAFPMIGGNEDQSDRVQAVHDI